MSDTRLLGAILDQILIGIARIERRMTNVTSPDDFLETEAGIDRLDGIAMMLIAIGEGLKNFERAGGKIFFDQHTEIDWKGAKGVRDFLSHHYFDIDAEVVFALCRQNIPPLKRTIILIRQQFPQSD